MRYLPPNEDKELLQLALTIQETFLFGHYIYIFLKNDLVYHNQSGSRQKQIRGLPIDESSAASSAAARQLRVAATPATPGGEKGRMGWGRGGRQGEGPPGRSWGPALLSYSPWNSLYPGLFSPFSGSRFPQRNIRRQAGVLKCPKSYENSKSQEPSDFSTM